MEVKRGNVIDWHMKEKKLLVAIRSCSNGTYLTACEDLKKVKLQHVEDTKNLPPSCLWSMDNEFASRSIASRFRSCYGNYIAYNSNGMSLTSKGYKWYITRANNESTRSVITCMRMTILVRKTMSFKANQDDSVSFGNFVTSVLWSKNPQCYWEIIPVFPVQEHGGDSSNINGPSVAPINSAHWGVCPPHLDGIRVSTTSNSGGNINGSGTQCVGNTNVKYELGNHTIYYYITNNFNNAVGP